MARDMAGEFKRPAPREGELLRDGPAGRQLVRLDRYELLRLVGLSARHVDPLVGELARIAQHKSVRSAGRERVPRRLESELGQRNLCFLCGLARRRTTE